MKRAVEEGLKRASLLDGIPEVGSALGKTVQGKGKDLGAVFGSRLFRNRYALGWSRIVENVRWLTHFADIHGRAIDYFHCVMCTIDDYIGGVLGITFVVQSEIARGAGETPELVGVHLHHFQTVVRKVGVGLALVIVPKVAFLTEIALVDVVRSLTIGDVRSDALVAGTQETILETISAVIVSFS